MGVLIAGEVDGGFDGGLVWEMGVDRWGLAWGDGPGRACMQVVFFGVVSPRLLSLVAPFCEASSITHRKG